MTRNAADIGVIRKQQQQADFDYGFFFDQQKKTGLEHRLSSLESSTGSINANFRHAGLFSFFSHDDILKAQKDDKFYGPLAFFCDSKFIYVPWLMTLSRGYK